MIAITDDDVRHMLAAFFAVFPEGAGATWLAGFVGVPRAQLDSVCESMGARRVERPGMDPKTRERVTLGIEWHAPPGARRSSS